MRLEQSKGRRAVFGVLVFVAGFAASRLIDRLEAPRNLAWANDDCGNEAVPLPPAPALAIAGDVDASGTLDLSDAVYLLNHLFNGGDAPRTPERRIKTLIITRHAEREPGGDDADLDEIGRRRAAQLAELLRFVDEPDHILLSTRPRTFQTLEPWIGTLPAAPPLEQLEAECDVVRRVRELPYGTTSVLCHHSFTLPDILCELGLQDAGALQWSGRSHDNLIIAQFPEGGEPTWVHMSYADLCPAEPAPDA